MSVRSLLSVLIVVSLLALCTRSAVAQTVCGGSQGPDVIVGALVGDGGDTASNYASQNVGGEWIDCFSVGTTSCNIGTERLLWIDEGGSNQHPVIGQNFFRLSNGRFEQLGQSWLKHGFFALQGSLCCSNCQPQNGDIALGVGCSDPYSASRNGGQGNGPKWQVNAHTGIHTHPVASATITGTASARLQIHVSDLNEPGALYWVEGQYVTEDDAAAGNQNNNASHRRVLVNGTGNDRTFVLTGPTIREEPAIRQWAINDPGVIETDIQIPGEGFLILAAKVTDLGNGLWNYEYALHNLNSDRSVSSFSVPIAGGATVQNIGFHDVQYHSGEPFDNTDWTGVKTGDAVEWATTPFSTNPNANALRWGTLYNFRFQTNVPPDTLPGEVTLGLFKPGTPTSVTATTVVPQPAAVLISLPGGEAPDLINNCEPLTLAVEIRDGTENFVPGTGRLHVSTTGEAGPFAEIPLASLGGNDYQVDFPACNCGDDVRYYFSAQASGGSTITLPGNALPDSNYFDAEVGFEQISTLFFEDFEAGLGPDWTATGLWNVTGQCPVEPMCTEAGNNWAYYGLPEACNYNTGTVHAGALQRTVTLPVSENIQLTYCSAYSRHAFPNGDRPELKIGGVVVDAPSAGVPGALPPVWEERTVNLTSYSGQTITLSFEFGNLVALSDTWLGWQIDDLHLTALQTFCAGCACGDMNADQATDGMDVQSFCDAVMSQSTLPQDVAGGDFTGDSAVTPADIDGMVDALLNGCE